MRDVYATHTSLLYQRGNVEERGSGDTVSDRNKVWRRIIVSENLLQKPGNSGRILSPAS